jgi:hypothetical protein
VPAPIQYGKVRFVNGGDIVHASELASYGNDHCDASFVCVSIKFKELIIFLIIIIITDEIFVSLP